MKVGVQFLCSLKMVSSIFKIIFDVSMTLSYTCKKNFKVFVVIN